MFLIRGGGIRNEIIWRRSSGHDLSDKNLDRITDTIFWYAKSEKTPAYTLTIPFTEEELKARPKSKTEVETGRMFYGTSSLEQIGNPKGVRIIQGKSVSTQLGWKWSQETFDERLKENPHLLHWTKNGKPRYKLYEDEHERKKLTNLWADIVPVSSSSNKRFGFPTQKPEALLERIIGIASREGDTVLDAYCGCGTTIFAAHKMKRKWIGIDVTYQSISLILKQLDGRFGKDNLNMETDGIPKDMESAKALSKKSQSRKEFEMWAIQTYSDGKASLNEKKGADGGIDGRMYIRATGKDDVPVLFQVKSGKVIEKDMREFIYVVDNEEAFAGVFITLKEPTKKMKEKAEEEGVKAHPFTNGDVRKIQIVTIEEILNGKRGNDCFQHIVDKINPRKESKNGMEKQGEFFTEKE